MTDATNRRRTRRPRVVDPENPGELASVASYCHVQHSQVCLGDP